MQTTYPMINGLSAYAISFVTGGKRKSFGVRYGKDIESTLSLAKAAFLRDYPDAHSFSITDITQGQVA